MRIWLSLTMLIAGVSFAEGPLESVLPKPELGITSGRVFVSTNSNHMPFYLLDKDLDLPSKLRKKVGTNDLAGVSYTTEAEQSLRMVDGKPVFLNYYVQRGRYAFMNGSRLTLVDFELVISNNEGTLDELLLVTCGTKSLVVESSFVQKLKSLRKSQELKGRASR